MLTKKIDSRRLFVGVTMLAIFYLQVTDPYGTLLMVADVGGVAPIWVRLIHAIDILLLIAVLIGYVRSHLWTYRLLLAETVYVLLTNATFVATSGLDRFTIGFGSEQYLTIFLVQVAARVALLGVLGYGRKTGVTEGRSIESEGGPPVQAFGGVTAGELKEHGGGQAAP